VTLVEEDPAALRALRANVDAVGLPGAHVVDEKVEDYLSFAPEPRYRLALLDPPYETDVVPVLEALRDWLPSDAVVAVERATARPRAGLAGGLRGPARRRYGAATLWYGSRS
jgi:16S rRNA (guanine966-N2)-methyltransferase